MSNNLLSNITRNVAEKIQEGFDSKIVLAKTVNTEILKGYPNPSSGETVYVRRHHQYRNVPTPDGDITSETWNDILSGRAPATTQDWITIPIRFDSMEEATELNKKDQILDPASTKVVTTLELKLAAFMQQNLGLSYGTPGTVVDAFSDIAGCDALMDEIGVMDNNKYYVNGSFTKMRLADAQAGLNSPGKVDSAWERSMTSPMVGGMQMLPSNTLKARTNGVCADRVGIVASAPDSTYVTAKDTMTQSLALSGLTTTGVIEEGEVIEYATVYQCNADTGETIYGADGDPLPFRQTVTAGVTLAGGAGTVTVSPAALFESEGQYNNVSKAIPQNEVATLLGNSGEVTKPNLFYQKNAIMLATVKLPKLHSTDTLVETKSGHAIRVSMYADGDASLQKLRLDLVPVLGVLNPMLGGQAWGVA